MKYCDLHCDALTATGAPQVTKERLVAGDCLLQCFAAFAEEGGFARFLTLADAFEELCRTQGFRRVLRAADLEENAVNVLLTSEGGTFSTIEELRGLYARGVRMAGFAGTGRRRRAFPISSDYAGVCAGRIPPSVREETRGLTAFGHEAAEEMARLGMIADVSHASDALFWEIASEKHPFRREPLGCGKSCRIGQET